MVSVYDLILISAYAFVVIFCLQETVSTCRFAQRVALIKNDISLNEELDPQLLIGRLKGEIVQLKEQLQLATGEQPKDALTEEELKR